MAGFLKDLIKSDINKVFLNLNDFAETHNINGVSLSCVLDIFEYQDQVALVRKEDLEGFNKVRARLHVNKDTLGFTVRHGDRINVDKEEYVVDTVSDEMGMLLIILETYGDGPIY